MKRIRESQRYRIYVELIQPSLKRWKLGYRGVWSGTRRQEAPTAAQAGPESTQRDGVHGKEERIDFVKPHSDTFCIY